MRDRRYAMDQYEDLQELLTRVNNVRDSLEEALGHVGGMRTTTGVACSKLISRALYAR
jgi:hypothetical protein